MTSETKIATVVGTVVLIAAAVMLVINRVSAEEQTKQCEDRALALAEAFQDQLVQYATTHHGYPPNVEATDLIKCIPPYDSVPVNEFDGKPIVLNGTDPGDLVYVDRGPTDYLILVIGANQKIIGKYAPEQPPLREDDEEASEVDHQVAEQVSE